MKDTSEPGLTPSQTVGPFFHGFLEQDGKLAGPQARGERIALTLRVIDGDGEPVGDAMVEIWQADADGKYDHPDDAQAKEPDPDFQGYGRLAADVNGVCVLETVRPGPVPGLDGSTQAPHVNVSIFARGILNRLATRVYFDGDPRNAGDPVLNRIPEERRHTLFAHRQAEGLGIWVLEIRLCGDGETVFFDV